MAKVDLTKVSESEFSEGQKIYSDVIARYYGDPDFKAKMDKDPTGTLKAAGMKLPEGVTVKLLVNTQDKIHIVLPNV